MLLLRLHGEGRVVSGLWFAIAAAYAAGGCFGFAAGWLARRERRIHGGMLDFTRRRIGT
jgi:ABC-type branched-subunit amino acid transport system permease subunit